MDGLCAGLYSFRIHVSRTDAVGDEARAVPTVLRGKAIELVDRRRRVRAQLNVSSDGEVIARIVPLSSRSRDETVPGSS